MSDGIYPRNAGLVQPMKINQCHTTHEQNEATVSKQCGAGSTVGRHTRGTELRAQK